jgi:hypothetical protein
MSTLFRTLILLLWLGVLFGCGGGSDGNTSSPEVTLPEPEPEPEYTTHCVINEKAALGSPLVTVQGKNTAGILNNSASATTRYTDSLIEKLPTYLQGMASDYLFLAIKNKAENGTVIEELHLKAETDLSVEFGFFINVNNESNQLRIINFILLGIEGWIQPGKYTEQDPELYIVDLMVKPYDDFCPNDYETTIIIDDIGYVNGAFSFVDMRFAVSCEEKELAGRLLWTNSYLHPQPTIEPIPDNFWTPPEHILALDKTHIYVADYRGLEFLQNQANSIFTLDEIQRPQGAVEAQFTSAGDATWSPTLVTMGGMNRFTEGLYNTTPDATPYELGPARMGWVFEGVLIPGQTGFTIQSWPNCQVDESYYVVDKAIYSEQGMLDLLDVRVTYECTDGNTSHARLLWNNNDTTQPPRPTEIPDDLWNISEDITLADGNYLYIEGDDGEYISDGLTYEYHFDNAQFVLEDDLAGAVNFRFITDKYASVGLFHMPSIDKFEKGFYGPYNFSANSNLARGFIYLGMNGRTASKFGGWYAIDHVTYENGKLTEMIMRFEVITNYTGKAARGKLVWSQDKGKKPSNPLSSPNNLWTPSASLENACGNKNTLRLEILSNSIWNRNDALGVTTVDKPVHIVFEQIIGGRVVYSAVNSWQLIFAAQTPNTIYEHVNEFSLYINGTYLQEKLEVGFYDNILGNNPAKGSVSLGMNSLTCSTEVGWINVDEVTYNSELELTHIDLRFAFSCASENSDTPTVNGRVNWTK